MKNQALSHTITTKGRKFHTEIYTKDEVMILADQCNKGVSGLRNKVLIVVLYRCGLRVSEVLSIKPSDYNQTEGSLRVIGKGNKMRMVGLDSQTRMNLDLWMLRRKELGINGSSPIFCGISKQNLGQPIQTVYIRNLLKKLGTKAGIEKRMNPHNFRHTFAHDLLNEGIGLQHIQISLGHSAIATTSKYLQRFNPRETIETIKERVW
jgi:integrase/recombinase XerD